MAQIFDVHPNQITDWKSRLLEGAAGVFDPEGVRPAPAVDVTTLHAKIGELTLENDFLEGALNKAGMLSAKRGSTARTHALLLKRQAEVLSQSSVYPSPRSQATPASPMAARSSAQRPQHPAKRRLVDRRIDMRSHRPAKVDLQPEAAARVSGAVTVTGNSFNPLPTSLARFACRRQW